MVNGRGRYSKVWLSKKLLILSLTHLDIGWGGLLEPHPHVKSTKKYLMSSRVNRRQFYLFVFEFCWILAESDQTLAVFIFKLSCKFLVPLTTDLNQQKFKPLNTFYWQNYLFYLCLNLLFNSIIVYNLVSTMAKIVNFSYSS